MDNVRITRNNVSSANHFILLQNLVAVTFNDIFRIMEERLSNKKSNKLQPFAKCFYLNKFH
jgi:hypothetical protein